MEAGSGEWSLVHQGRDDDGWREADEGFAGGRQKKLRRAADASTEDDDLGCEGSGVLIERKAEVPAEIGKSLAGCFQGRIRRVARCGSGCELGRPGLLGQCCVERRAGLVVDALGYRGYVGDIGFKAGKRQVLLAKEAG